MKRNIFESKSGFTFVEIMVIVIIIALLATAILVSIDQGRKNARINAAKTSLKAVLPAIIACKDSGGIVSSPPVADANVCATAVGLVGAKWPELKYGYAYGSGTYDSVACDFIVDTGSDETKSGNTFLTCSCAKQICE
ncbi:MAG: hypothetical protein UT50_C0009G0026 [Candidatus Moranbacteria bacterium GW2011_GWA2_39_41]|nr:MAG: hypothetical protein UT50_C0009G0026 [Candidatus Moranbacteria bacterium GW2011_GWA2_39_41]